LIWRKRRFEMRYKLIAADIDGTLLNSKGRLTEETKQAIRQAVDKGVVFAISTGRPLQGLKPVVDEIGFDLPLITYNGAMLIMGKSQNVIYEKKLSRDNCIKVLELGKERGTNIVVWNDNKLYCDKINSKTIEYGKLTRTKPILSEHLDKTVDTGATKILWYDDIPLISKYEKEINEIFRGSINVHISRPMFLEFVDKDASKAIAMHKLGEYYGIDRSEMIAIGDSSNDISMIEYAGLGIAMENARKDIKDKADYVTLSNDDNGVAHVIRKFILQDDH